MEETRRDAGVNNANEDRIRDLNEAVASSDLRRFTEGMKPDAVWEHNPGTGSPEEGTYEGREQIRQLFERLLEGWEYMRPSPNEIREIESGVYDIRGELHSKHAATENVIVSPYEQRLEIRDGLMVWCRMLVGSAARQ
jgi:ketosteroid isomerase-like protein